MGYRFPLFGIARQFRTDIGTLFCRRIRGGPPLSDRALALDRIAGSLCTVCMAAGLVWLAGLMLPEEMEISPISESAQAASGGQSPAADGIGSGAADMSLGSAEVRTLQMRLRTLGYDPGAVDGIAGPRTLKALNRYRASMKLDRVGYVDRSTAAGLTD